MRRVALALVFATLVGCDDELEPPKIDIDISPVNVGIHSTSPDAGTYHFDLQLINIGEETLVIQSVDYRGDQNCAFTFDGPDLLEMGENESSFVRGWYDPVVEGEDQIAMDVVSNAVNYPTMVVPICGKAVPPGTEDAGMPVCQVPPADQPDCEEL
jgi:hypothetical protein